MNARKGYLTVILMMIAVIMLSGCTAGPAGPAGSVGEQGPPGEQGLPGNDAVAAPYHMPVSIWMYPDVDGGSDPEPQNDGAIDARAQVVGGNFEVRAVVRAWTSVNDPGTVIYFLPEQQPDLFFAFDDYGVCSVERPSRGWLQIGVAEWHWLDVDLGIVAARCIFDIDQRTSVFGKRLPWTLGGDDVIRLSLPFAEIQ